MARVATAGAQAIYSAAARWVQDCLSAGGSLFTPGASIWSQANLDDLHARFNAKPDESKDTFIAKFERQLAGAPAATMQLAAEVLYVHVLVAANMRGPTKRALVRQVLSWSAEPVEIPEALALALDSGLANAGVAFNIFRPYQLHLIIDLARELRARGVEEWDDPTLFKTLLFGISIYGAHTQREALLHLVFPDDFEPILSADHKQLIVAAFGEPGDDPAENVDRALARIRARLTPEHGEDFSFYAPAIAARWRTGPAPKGGAAPAGEPAPGGRRAWLVRGANVDGRNMVPEWLSGGFCSIGWDELGELSAAPSRVDLISLLRTHYPDKAEGAVRADAGTLLRFLVLMALDDLVLTVDGVNVYAGTVTSDATFEPGPIPHTSRRRTVAWANPESPVPRTELSPGLAAHLKVGLTVTEVTEHLAEVEAMAEGATPLPEPPTHALPAATAELADSLLMPLDWLDEVIHLLAERRQVIFYGPPGTGKTYVAQRLAKHLTSAGGEVTLVQFHPSYAYEDFFEGYRPRPVAEGDGRIAFEITPGPLRAIADAARRDLGRPYLLVIDEINRANLAKVFGELYFLLEYRDETVSLQYSSGDDGEGFGLPANLYLIGTMNTADRSIALVDAAMRRRFYFVAFFPDRPPIQGLLRRWLHQRGLSPRAADLLDELNRRITERDFTIGPSYLMNARIDEPGVIERIWTHAILPLLEEQHAATGLDVESRFGLASLQATIADQPSA